MGRRRKRKESNTTKKPCHRGGIDQPNNHSTIPTEETSLADTKDPMDNNNYSERGTSEIDVSTTLDHVELSLIISDNDLDHTSNASRNHKVDASILPQIVWLQVLSMCDCRTLGQISQVCKYFNMLACSNRVWRQLLRNSLITGTLVNCKADDVIFSDWTRFRQKFDFKAFFKISKNWRDGNYTETLIYDQRERYMPWMQQDSNFFWLSRGRSIVCCGKHRDGSVVRQPKYVSKLDTEDACKFTKKQEYLVAGERGGSRSLYCWCSYSGHLMQKNQNAHNDEIRAVEMTNDGSVLVSASRDHIVKVWNMADFLSDPQHEADSVVDCGDCVWSLAMHPCSKQCYVGMAGFGEISPLVNIDLELGKVTSHMGQPQRNGDGVLDITFMQPNTLATGGYNTCVRVWDLRTSQCVVRMEDPHDSVIYSVVSDGGNGIVCGTSRYGLVRLWDVRSPKKEVQMFFVQSSWSSPVYSILLQPTHLYVALDRSTHFLNFHL